MEEGSSASEPSMPALPAYDEDYFADTRMSFGDHIEDLRKHLIRGFYGFLVGMAIAAFFAKPTLRLINEPVEQAMQAFYDERAAKLQAELLAKAKAEQPAKLERVEISAKELAAALRQLFPELLARQPDPPGDAPAIELNLKINPAQFALDLQPIMQKLGKRPGLSTLSPIESFLVFMKVWIVLALIISSPWLLYQLWLFIAAGLYPHERKYVTGYLPLSIALFLGGVALCQFLVLPTALGALLAFNQWLNVEPDFRLSDWLSFAILLPLITGICFETPLVMLVLARIGVADSRLYQRYWRIAIFLMLVVAAIFSPTVDPLSLFFLWVPMVGLYFLGIWLVKRNEGPLDPETWEEEVTYQAEKAK